MVIAFNRFLAFVSFFFQSAIGKQITEKVKAKLGMVKKPKIYSRRFVGAAILIISALASHFLGVSIADSQVNEITDIAIKVLDIVTVYGGSLSLFGLINRKQA